MTSAPAVCNLEVSFFVDGVLGSVQTASFPGQCPSTCEQPTTVGDNGFMGTLGQVIMYPTALNDSKVADIAANTHCVVTSPDAVFCIMSDSEVAGTSTVGNTLTVSVNASEPIHVPSITCNINGGPSMVFAVVTGVDGDSEYDATYTLIGGEGTGLVVCTVPLVDLNGATGVATQNPSDGCSDVNTGEPNI